MKGSIALCVAAGLVSGCSKKKDDKEKENTEKVTEGSGTAKADPAKKVGMEDPTNDPKVVEAAKKLLADCGAVLDESTGSSSKPNQKKSFYSCEKWGEDFGNLQFDKADATFVNLLEDPDIKVRTVAVAGLNKVWEWRSDKALAARVVNALKNEKAPSGIDHNLALRVADIPSDAGLDDQIKAIAIDPNTSVDVKMGLLAWWRGPAAYEAVKTLASTTDPNVMNAVVQGYVLHFEDHTEEACAYWVDHLETPNDQANEYALGHLTGGWGGNTTGDSESEDYISGGGGGPGYSDTKRCSADQLTKALDYIEKQLAAGKTDSKLTYSLAYLAKDKLSPEPIKTRTVGILKKMTETKGDSWMRGNALRALTDSGDPEMMKYAQGFKDDEELKDTVERINQDAAERAAEEKKQAEEEAKNK